MPLTRISRPIEALAFRVSLYVFKSVSSIDIITISLKLIEANWCVQLMHRNKLEAVIGGNRGWGGVLYLKGAFCALHVQHSFNKHVISNTTRCTRGNRPKQRRHQAAARGTEIKLIFPECIAVRRCENNKACIAIKVCTRSWCVQVYMGRSGTLIHGTFSRFDRQTSCPDRATC